MRNRQYGIDHPTKKLKGKICIKDKGDCLNRVHSDQMVLGTLKTMLTQGVPTDASPLRSDGSRDGLAGGWTL